LGSKKAKTQGGGREKVVYTISSRQGTNAACTKIKREKLRGVGEDTIIIRGEESGRIVGRQNGKGGRISKKEKNKGKTEEKWSWRGKVKNWGRSQKNGVE